MFEHLTQIQTFVLITNSIEIIALPVLYYVVYTSRKRAYKKYNEIGKQLDHILLLSHELYQTEVKEKDKH